MYLPVLEKTKSTLIVFSDQDTFKDLGKNEYFNMLHIDVKIHKSVATIKLPDGKDVSKSFLRVSCLKSLGLPHFLMKWVFTQTFPGNQNATLK